MEDVKLAAKRGAYWLDTVYPEWTSAINLEGVNLKYPEACVLGQLAGDFDEFSEWLHNGIADCDYGSDDDSNCEACGFLVDQGFYTLQSYSRAMETYADLTAAWKEQIKERT